MCMCREDTTCLCSPPPTWSMLCDIYLILFMLVYCVKINTHDAAIAAPSCHGCLQTAVWVILWRSCCLYGKRSSSLNEHCECVVRIQGFCSVTLCECVFCLCVSVLVLGLHAVSAPVARCAVHIGAVHFCGISGCRLMQK